MQNEEQDRSEWAAWKKRLGSGEAPDAESAEDNPADATEAERQPRWTGEPTESYSLHQIHEELVFIRQLIRPVCTLLNILIAMLLIAVVVLVVAFILTR